MMYSEFLKGTGAPESDPRTYEQFEALEKVYMLSDSMSKQEVYKFWKQTFGHAIKAEVEKFKAEAELVISEDATFLWNNGYHSDEAERICLNRLSHIKASLQSGFYRWENIQYTDKAGYQWTVRTDDNPNLTKNLRLHCTTPKGKTLDVHYCIHEYNVPRVA